MVTFSTLKIANTVMPRPQTKKDLQELSGKNYAKLMDYINGLPDEEQQREFPQGTLNRNIRDVICHLYHWHLMVLEWYEVGMRGEQPDIPSKEYNWRQIPQLNRDIREKYNATPLEEAKALLEKSHLDIMSLVDKHDNDALFERARYEWTGNNALGAYLVSCTSSHYEWGLKLIRRARKKR